MWNLTMHSTLFRRLFTPALAWVLAALWHVPAHAGIAIEHWTEASGARVYLVASPAIPMVDVQIDFDGGSRRDPAQQVGLASATASLLSAGVHAWQGQPARDENALAEAWLDTGAQAGASAGADRFTLSLRSLTDAAWLPKAVALAAQQMAAPSFPEAVWQRDRERQIAALQEAENRPATHANRAFGKAVYGEHPYGRESTAASLRAITVADMRAHYTRTVQACRAVVTVVGAVDKAGAQAIVRPLVQAMGQQPCQALPAVPEVAPLTAALEQAVPFQSAQAQVLVGQPAIARNDPDFFPLFVGNYTLGGGGFVSRLTTEVREKRGLSYSVYSYFAPGLHAGAFQIGLSTRPDQAAQALGVARQVLSDFVAQGPTEAELQAAKDFLIKGFALRIDSNRKLLDNVANIAWHGLPLDYLDTWTQQVQAVTTADIRRAFQRVIQPERMVTVVVGAR
jgi:zinc protease